MLSARPAHHRRARRARFRTALLTSLSLLTPPLTGGASLTLLTAGAARAAQPGLGSVQLTFTVDDADLYVNGAPQRWLSPPRNIGGRTMLPLRETAALLGQPLQVR